MAPKDVQSSLVQISPDHVRRRRDIITCSNSSNSFTFGVITDVQWADAPDGSNYTKTVKRHYRGSFRNLRDAVDYWNSLDDVQFIAQLGDLIDGSNRRTPAESDRALSLALDQLSRVSNGNCPSVNLVGNHELYNFNRQELALASWLRHGDSEYYSFIPARSWRVVVLDPYQISLIGHSCDDPRRHEAVEIMKRENPNVSSDGTDGNWFEGIEGYQRRFCPYNGGYGPQQLEWFRNELQNAAAEEERVLVMSHTIIHPKACGGNTMAWDYEQALAIIHESSSSKDSSVVVAVLCGHDHSGNYHCDECGVHHCTFMSPLNKGDDGSAFGLIHVTPDCMEIRGPKLDDFLPNVEGRPEILKCFGGDELLMLPIRPVAISSTTLTRQKAMAAGAKGAV
mmetsp:Transcript_22563/g.27841  ORF Transcript_22563/g.27841 Transcript_22563/m.27841 type:complete len:395 (+) Transcript_22563:209-1393(+)|eukprot:CAMPEP_0172515274 /NCGR_PEP_ID=MMETSP1066-20121228/266752_1 /TAXON_ID=671091 /ORGANISM="Coscinodiscus wailesii, Strain CCMP2513" /LENGTH=394 /DNA_ID=CAMNT_0013296287 /DNA_START=202 /DNA_END=1389 /DNA_ORIENTATION=+